MTRLLQIIHRTCCEQFDVGTMFLLTYSLTRTLRLSRGGRHDCLHPALSRASASDCASYYVHLLVCSIEIKHVSVIKTIFEIYIKFDASQGVTFFTNNNYLFTAFLSLKIVVTDNDNCRLSYHIDLVPLHLYFHES